MKHSLGLWLSTLLIFIGALAFHSWYAFDGIAVFDLGILTDGALRTLRGQWFAVDFMAPYGPLRYWMVALCFAGLGAKLSAWATLAAVLQALADAVLFRLATLWSSFDGALWAAVMLAVAHGSLHKSFLLLGVVLILVAAAVLEYHRASYAAGVLAGLAFLLRYDVGVFGGFALTMQGFFGEQKGRRIPWLLLGWCTPVGLVALLLWGAGAHPGEWWDHTLQRIAVQERIRWPFPWPVLEGGHLRLGRLALLLALITTPVLYGCWIVGVLRRRAKRSSLDGDGMRLSVAILGLLLLNQARLVPTTNHLFQGLAPAYLGLADLFCRRGRSVMARSTLVVLTGALMLWVHTSTSGLYPGSYTAKLKSGVRLEVPTAGVEVPYDELESWNRTIFHLQDLVPLGQKLGVGPGCAIFGLLTGRELGVPYAEPSYYYRNAEYQRRLIDALDRDVVPAIVHDLRPSATFALHQEAPLVWQYLRRNYREVGQYGPFQIYARIHR